MHVIQIHNITVNLAGREVFRDLAWVIDDRAHIGLVGPNGAGKSTLLKVVSGDLVPEKGSIARINGISVGYLPQDVTLPAGTLWEAATVPSPELAAALAQLEAAESRLDDPEVYNDINALEAALEAQQIALNRCEKLDSARHESLVLELLTRLGFEASDLDLPTSALSGGQKKLVALARLAAWSPDILLLDEPDNHLDLKAKAYLETFIRSYQGGVVIVSHDRYLLDECVTHVAELDEGKITMYVGNYSEYAMERDLRRIRQEQTYKSQHRRIAQIEARIHEWDLAAKADNERAARQAASRRKMLARMEANGEIIEKVRDRKYMELEIGGSRGSTKALELENVTMGFNDDLLFMDVNLLVQHSERVGLIGQNGAGKSVLFSLIREHLFPLSGRVKVGPSTRIGYYAQQHETLTQWYNRTPIDLIRDIQVMPESTAVNKLLKFAFSYQQVRQPIGTLSGGERSRLQLLTLVLQQPNLLLLDEPTNNLDIGSAEVLETALDEFEGAVLVISHDRYFLDRVVDRIVELEDGSLTEYSGNYADFVRQKEENRLRRLQKMQKSQKNSSKSTTSQSSQPSQPMKKRA